MWSETKSCTKEPIPVHMWTCTPLSLHRLALQHVALVVQCVNTGMNNSENQTFSSKVGNVSEFAGHHLLFQITQLKK